MLSQSRNLVPICIGEDFGAYNLIILHKWCDFVNISREAYAQWQHKNAESRGFFRKVSSRQLAYVDRYLENIESS